MATKEFKCKVCGYVHKGDKAPDVCPVCKAPASEFELIKKGLDTNSNIYTVAYAAVMVVIVAFLLVFVSDSLKERQQINIIQDTYKQILYSLNIREMSNVSETYKSTIEGDYLMSADGSLQKQSDEDFCTSYKSEFKSGRLHVFQANIDGTVKYVIPVNGLGLWGDIWGYIAVNEDRNTIYGTYFSHASETPGLGGEVGTQYFQDRFVGKQISQNGNIELSVVKFGQAKDESFEVDGLSGATITSNGVNAMINDVLEAYKPFFNANK